MNLQLFTACCILTVCLLLGCESEHGSTTAPAVSDTPPKSGEDMTTHSVEVAYHADTPKEVHKTESTEPTESEEDDQHPIVGEWELVSDSIEATLTFTADGKFEAVAIGERSILLQEGTWEIEGEYITATFVETADSGSRVVSSSGSRRYSVVSRDEIESLVIESVVTEKFKRTK